MGIDEGGRFHIAGRLLFASVLTSIELLYLHKFVNRRFGYKYE